MMSRKGSFLSLVDVHERLDELFLLHQEALLAIDVPLAAERLLIFEREILAHMRVEEELLLPIYQRAGRVLHGPIELYTGEHKRMVEFLAKFKLALSSMQPTPADLERRIIKLFDHQALFKSLVEHHGSREEQLLYPILDRVTSEEEREELLKRSMTMELVP
jgi:iron-sulfur cluster repair protein YtfE (RIC family)